MIYFFIKKTTLYLNNKPLGALSEDATEKWAMVDFKRLLTFTQLDGTPLSNSIGIDDFMNGYYFTAHDLSTSGKCGMDLMAPSVRLGHVRMRVDFSAETFEEMSNVNLRM